jgi:hypothetical protein
MQSTRLLNRRRFLHVTLRDPQLRRSSAAYLERQPGISGRIGEADSAQPTWDGPCHGRLGFWPGLGPHIAATMRMRGALRTFGLGCTLPRGAAHTFQAYNQTRTARVQLMHGQSAFSRMRARCQNVAFGTRRSGSRLPVPLFRRVPP